MTDPEDEEVSLEHRIDELEKWRAAQEAVASSRKWLIPVLVTAVVALASVVNVTLTLSRHH